MAGRPVGDLGRWTELIGVDVVHRRRARVDEVGGTQVTNSAVAGGHSRAAGRIVAPDNWPGLVAAIHEPRHTFAAVTDRAVRCVKRGPVRRGDLRWPDGLPGPNQTAA